MIETFCTDKRQNKMQKTIERIFASIKEALKKAKQFENDNNNNNETYDWVLSTFKQRIKKTRKLRKRPSRYITGFKMVKN